MSNPSPPIHTSSEPTSTPSRTLAAASSSTTPFSTAAAVGPSSSDIAPVSNNGRRQRLSSRLKTRLQTADRVTRDWLIRNSRLLTTLCDILHSLALITPSSSSSSATSKHTPQLRAEAAATLLSLLRIYRSYPHISSVRVLLLNVLKSLQLLLEMATLAKSPDNHLAVVEAVEAAKAVLRLSLLKSFGRPVTARDESLPSDDEVEAGANVNACTCGLQDLPHAKHVEMDKGPRTDSAILRLRHHRAMLNQSQFASHNKFINRPLSTARIAGLEPVPSILTKREHGGRLVGIGTERDFTSTSTSDVDDHEDPLLEALFVVAYERRSNWVIRMFMPQLDCPACHGVVVLPTPTLTDTLNGIQHSVENFPPAAVAAEVAYIARPVLHVMLIRRFGWRSWRAWMAALVIDIASRALLSRYDEQTDDERVERRRRMANLLLYLGRSPLFDVLLRVVIKRATSPLRAIPLVGGLVSSAISWITLLQQYWFYTSGS